MRSHLLFAFAVAMFGLSSVQAKADVNDSIRFSQAGNVSLTLDLSTGGLDHILELANVTGPVGTPLMALTEIGGQPSENVLGYAPANLGDTIALGAFAVNEELIFRLTNVGSLRLGVPGEIGDQTFTGSASGTNPSPTSIYTLVEFVDPLTIRVYWEDLFPISADNPDPADALLQGGDDVRFTLTLTPSVPEPTALVLVAIVAGIVGCFRRRRC